MSEKNEKFNDLNQGNYTQIQAKYVETKFKKRSFNNNSDSIWYVTVFELLEPVEYLDHKYEKGDTLTVKGEDIPEIQIKYELNGNWDYSKKYGLSFNLIYATEIVEKNKEDIIAFLSSGVIKGVGEAMAERIYDKFGNDTIDILNNSPEKLLDVSGIGEKKLKDIISCYEENKWKRDIIATLSKYGVSKRNIDKFISDYGARAKKTFEKNPYVLIKYIGFNSANEIAIIREIPKEQRLAYVFRYILDEIGFGFAFHDFISGSLIAEKDKVIYTAVVIAKDIISNEEYEMSKEYFKDAGIVEEEFEGKTYLMKKNSQKAEITVADTIINLLTNDNNKGNISAIKAVDQVEEEFFELEGGQEEAVMKSLYNDFSIITGGPGTGKTTIIKFIVEAYKKAFPGNDIILMAPTGKAAQKMFESTGREAKTLHSRLGIYNAGETEVVLENSLIIVDEISMLDIYVAETFFKSIGEGCKVVLVGDMDQLPSVDAGNFLKDAIESGVIPVTKLTKIYRQSAEGSGKNIAINSQRINKGITVLKNTNDYRHIEVSNQEDAVRHIVDNYKDAVDAFGIDNVVYLSPFRKRTITGVDSMNKILQAEINPAKPDLAEIEFRDNIFRVGDKVMQIVNNQYAVNGDVGYIVDITTSGDKDEDKISVLFRDTLVTYEREKFADLELAYAMTVHKSQGSEYTAVIFNLMDMHYIMLKRNLLYTAITRATNYLTLIGNRSAVYKSIIDNSSLDRETFLKERLQGLI